MRSYRSAPVKSDSLIYQNLTGQAEQTFHRETYDISKVVAEAKDYDPGIPYLSDVMMRK